MELVYRDLLVKEVSGELESGEQEALPLIAEAYYHLSQLVQSMESLEPSRVQPPRLLDGRPRYNVSYHQLDALVSMHLTVPQISQIVGVSVSNLSIRNTYSIWMQLFVINFLVGGIARFMVASYLVEYSKESVKPNVVWTQKGLSCAV